MKFALLVAISLLLAFHPASTLASPILACVEEPCYAPIIGFGNNAETAENDCGSQNCYEACDEYCETPNWYSQQCDPGFWSGIGELWVSEGHCTCIPDPR